jgi:hypothetical protein
MEHHVLTSPLGDETQSDRDKEPVAIALGLGHIGIRGALGGLQLCVDGGLDLHDLSGDDGVGAVAASVMLGKNFGGFLDTAYADEPAGALGGHEEAGEGGEGEEDLQQDGDTPGPVRGDDTGAEGDPTTDCTSQIPFKSH